MRSIKDSDGVQRLILATSKEVSSKIPRSPFRKNLKLKGTLFHRMGDFSNSKLDGQSSRLHS